MKAEDLRFRVTPWTTTDGERQTQRLQLTADLGDNKKMSLRMGINGRHYRRWFALIEAPNWVSVTPESYPTILEAANGGLQHATNMDD